MKFKENQTPKKLRGGYYTPNNLAHYLSRWVAEISPSRILEPSCGDGAFFQPLAEALTSHANLTAIELDEVEAAKAVENSTNLSGLTIDVKCTDFLEWYLFLSNRKPNFDAVVGNPPFVRYQYLGSAAQAYAEKIFQSFGLKFTRHTNAWVPFVVSSLSLLRAGGRLAMVLPSEILHVLHAQSLRSFLGHQCKKLTIIDPEEIWFSGTLQGAILLMAEKKEFVEQESEGVGVVKTTGEAFLSKVDPFVFAETKYLNGKTVEGKWTRALLNAKELDLYEKVTAHEDVHLFSDIASVDVGIVTGANRFFLVDDATVRQYALEQWAHPMFGRSEHCPGVLYDDRQHQSNTERGLPTNFLWFDVHSQKDLNSKARKYIRLGESQDLNTRYKCRIRSPWYKVPSVYSTPVGMLKRSHNYPRLILNSANALTTDTAYRISTEVDAKKLVYSFVNSFTALSAELEGRHYGGGVLELVPSEIEKLRVPIPRGIRPAIKSLDSSVRSREQEETLKMQDQKILSRLGLSPAEIATLHGAWLKLRNRRQRNGENN